MISLAHELFMSEHYPVTLKQIASETEEQRKERLRIRHEKVEQQGEPKNYKRKRKGRQKQNTTINRWSISILVRYGVTMRAQEEEKSTSEDERWARLDKRIERARARHELACPVMGTILLVKLENHVTEHTECTT